MQYKLLSKIIDDDMRYKIMRYSCDTKDLESQNKEIVLYSNGLTMCFMLGIFENMKLV